MAVDDTKKIRAIGLAGSVDLWVATEERAMAQVHRAEAFQLDAHAHLREVRLELAKARQAAHAAHLEACEACSRQAATMAPAGPQGEIAKAVN